jgi:hypothetical protein
MPRLISSHLTPLRTTLLFIICSLLLLGVVTVGARAWLAPAEVQGQAPQGRVEAELLTIRPTGFDPVEITRPRGSFLLVVNNRSGVGELDLRLDREGAGRQHEARMPRGKLGWKKRIDLPPGKYTLTETNHPDWVCHITITTN